MVLRPRLAEGKRAVNFRIRWLTALVACGAAGSGAGRPPPRRGSRPAASRRWMPLRHRSRPARSPRLFRAGGRDRPRRRGLSGLANPRARAAPSRPHRRAVQLGRADRRLRILVDGRGAAVAMRPGASRPCRNSGERPLFSVRLWVVDAIAERHKISREEAWRGFKSCLEDREARKAGAVLGCDTL